jgi:hypothetical protein
MTHDDIIRMAREAAQKPEWSDRAVEVYGLRDIAMLERFAALVAAAEREACAQIAEEWLGPTKDRELHIAAAIRARGQA